MTKKPTSRRINPTGQRFDRLLVLSESHRTAKGAWYWVCRCDCGKETRVQTQFLMSGRTKSCGCKRASGIHSIKHKLTGTWVYYTYKGIFQRCYSPTNSSYANYGGRGIKMCDRWLRGDGSLHGIQCFYADMGDKPSPNHSIERLDVNGDYSPENCVWIPQPDQAKNTRANRRVTAFGKTKILADWAREYGLSARMIQKRLVRGWVPERAISTPSRTSLPLHKA
jgi:hypothetical protein